MLFPCTCTNYYPDLKSLAYPPTAILSCTILYHIDSAKIRRELQPLLIAACVATSQFITSGAYYSMPLDPTTESPQWFDDFYETQLFLFVLITILLWILQRYIVRNFGNRIPLVDVPGIDPADPNQTSNYTTLKWVYLVVYGIVMWSDWLQGPYIYSLYREEHGLSERQVAALFAIGFSSAGIAAPFIGAWADQYGRKRLCLIFCISYSMACVFTWSGFTLFTLVLGRFLGGVSTSILFSIFESWLVTSASNNYLSEKELSEIMGTATLVNGLVATLAGIFSNYVVERSQSLKTPFYASSVSLLLGWLTIKFLWNENYGSTTTTGLFQAKRLWTAFGILKRDASLISLIVVQTSFEGVMYLFVFLWVSFLQELPPVTGPTLPLGHIFSCYMLSMIFGSLVYNTIVTLSFATTPSKSNLTLHTILSICVTTLSACSLLFSVLTTNNRYRFWAFCGFEACVGMYYPVQGVLRSIIVSEDHRGTLNALARVPLNIFVVVMLLTGVDEARRYVLMSGAGALVLSATVIALVIPRQLRSVSLPSSPEENN